MAVLVCRLRPIFIRLVNNLEKRILFSAKNSRTYALASSSSTVLNNFNLKHSYDKVVITNGTVSAFRLFSSEKKLTKEEISEKVLNICKIFDRIPVDKLTLESHFMNDLGLDSLDHVEIIMNIEDDFNFEIPDADAEKLLRPVDIVAYIEQKELAGSQH